MGIEVLVVQHGEKDRSPGDPGLTEVGRLQAAAVAGWLTEHRVAVEAVIASPLRRAQETAAPIAAALGLTVTTDARFRERMNWNDDASIGFDEFLVEWQRATDDRSHRPPVGDSSIDAAARFIDGLVDLEYDRSEIVVVVSHGGVTVDALRTIAGDSMVGAADEHLIADGVPNCAITRLRVADGDVTVVSYPSTAHLDGPGRPR